MVDIDPTLLYDLGAPFFKRLRVEILRIFHEDLLRDFPFGDSLVSARSIDVQERVYRRLFGCNIMSERDDLVSLKRRMLFARQIYFDRLVIAPYLFYYSFVRSLRCEPTDPRVCPMALPYLGGLWHFRGVRDRLALEIIQRLRIYLVPSSLHVSCRFSIYFPPDADGNVEALPDHYRACTCVSGEGYEIVVNPRYIDSPSRLVAILSHELCHCKVFVPSEVPRKGRRQRDVSHTKKWWDAAHHLNYVVPSLDEIWLGYPHFTLSELASSCLT